MLIRKIQCQLAHSISTPPSTGPERGGHERDHRDQGEAAAALLGREHEDGDRESERREDARAHALDHAEGHQPLDRPAAAHGPSRW